MLCGQACLPRPPCVQVLTTTQFRDGPPPNKTDSFDRARLVLTNSQIQQLHLSGSPEKDAATQRSLLGGEGLDQCRIGGEAEAPVWRNVAACVCVCVCSRGYRSRHHSRFSTSPVWGTLVLKSCHFPGQLRGPTAHYHTPPSSPGGLPSCLLLEVNLNALRLSR